MTKLDVRALEYFIEIYDKARSLNLEVSETPKAVADMLGFIRKYKISTVARDGLAAKIVYTSTKDENARPVVFFIHGWKGDPDSFSDFPRYVSNDLGVETKIYHYPTAALGRTPSIVFVAQNMDNWIRNNIKSRTRKIGIIAHSMGGLIARKMITSQAFRETPIDTQIKQITFIASPHTGVWLAKASKIFGNVASYQSSELSPDSPVLSEIVQTWSAYLRKRNEFRASVRSLYGTSDNVVDTAVAIGDDPEAVPILNAGHIDIVKPSCETDEVVVTVSRFIREAELVA